MTREETLDLIARLAVAWARRDAQALAAEYSDDAEIASPMFGRHAGRAAIEQSYRSAFRIFPDWSFVGEEVVIDGDNAVQIFTVSATHTHEFLGLPGSGRTFQIHGALHFRFENGRIAFERRIYDFTGLLVQLGVLKAKPAS
jgi:steroid delta-isomerase-like uncharacterized protein